MAIGTKADFVIYPDEFFGGMQERLDRNTAVFNGASNGALALVTESLKGDYAARAFFKRVSGLIAHRDPTSTASVADKKLEQGENVSPKVNRRIGPVADTIDAFRKINEDPQLFSFLLGQQIAEDVQADYVDSIITSIVAALSGEAATNVHDATDGVLEHADLSAGLFKFGDRMGDVAAWVTHSGSLKGLVDSALAVQLDSVAGAVIYGGSPGTFGKPVVVVDSPALAYDTVGDGSGDARYRTLALVEGAGVVTQSDQRTIISDNVTGLANLVMRIQGEHAFNLSVKGFAFDRATINPDSTAYGASANWTKVAASHKDTAGILINSQ